MFFDTIIVGAGPAGLSAAIRLKQMAVKDGKDVSVCVVEKGSEVGAHILSGNVFETTAMDELFPDWRKDIENGNGPPIETKTTKDKFLVLTGATSSVTIPNFLLPSELHNEGNYIISLSQLTRWLGAKAEELGVEVYPGFAASEVLYNAAGSAVLGVATKDAGIGKDGQLKDSFARGMELLARQTLFAEGARGSCSEEVIQKFSLRVPGEHDVQSYGLGIKEAWQVPASQFKSGYVQHTLGYPLQASPLSDVFGGTFLYHMEPNLVVLGMVVGLDYKVSTACLLVNAAV
jgi:electron-transferring-flavoprotein dehydrogenase